MALTVVLAAGRPLAAGPPTKKCGFVPPRSIEDVLLKQGTRPPADAFLDSRTYPIRVHYLTGDASVASTTLEAAETAWEHEVVAWGWDAPIEDGSYGGSLDLVDFYLRDTPFAGYADTDECWLAATRVVCQGFVVVNRSMTSTEIRGTVAHELNHLLQLGVDAWEDQQLFEASAVFVESWVEPTDVAAWAFATYYQDGYYRALDYYDYAEPPQYGSFIFLQYLAERFDDATPASIGELWRLSAQPAWSNSVTWMTALDDWLLARWPASDPPGTASEARIEAAWREFSEYRYFLGGNDDGLHLQHGHTGMPGLELPLVGSMQAVTLATSGAGVDLPQAMGELSTGVLRVTGITEQDTIGATFTAAAGLNRWALSILQLDAAGSLVDREIGSIGAGTAEIDAEIVPAAQSAVVILAALGDGTLNPNDDDWTGVGGTLTLSYSPHSLPGDSPARREPDGGCDCAGSGSPALILLAGALWRRIRA